jgi:hypothetical protein
MRHITFRLVVAAPIFICSASALAQAKLATDELVDALRLPVSGVEIDVKDIHDRAVERMKKPGKPQDRPALVEELNKLPQLTLDIQFNSDSAIIRPESYKLLGRLADALYHPYLLDQKILIVGHIEATGKRPSNLDLSQKRAAAIREAGDHFPRFAAASCCAGAGRRTVAGSCQADFAFEPAGATDRDRKALRVVARRSLLK